MAGRDDRKKETHKVPVRVLLLHGGPGLAGKYLFPAVSRLFPAPAFVTVAPDYGGALTYEEVLASLREQIAAGEAASGGRFGEADVVFAHSWGSYLALELVRRRMLSPRALFILSNPVPLTSELAEKVQQKLMERVSPRALAGMDALPETPDKGARIMRLALRAYCGHREKLPDLSFEYWPERGDAVIAQTPAHDHVVTYMRIAERTLLLFGKTDYIAPEDFGVDLSGAGSAGRVLMMPKGHFGFAEATPSYRKAIRDFLEFRRVIVD